MKGNDLMESVFDYDVNENELNYLLIRHNREEYLKNASKFKIYSDLYHLFKIRGNDSKAEEIYRKLLNE